MGKILELNIETDTFVVLIKQKKKSKMYSGDDFPVIVRDSQFGSYANIR